MKKCPKCSETYQDFADTCPKCNVDLDTGLKIEVAKSGNSLKKILAFVLDLIIAYFLSGIIVFLAGFIIFQGIVILGQIVPSLREGISSFLKIFDFLIEKAPIVLIILYFIVIPKLIGKTFGKKLLKI